MRRSNLPKTKTMNTIKHNRLSVRLKTLLLALTAFACLTASEAGEIQEYTGFLGGESIELVMKWTSSGEIFGVLFFQGADIELKGTNPQAGVIEFKCRDGAVYNLTKRLTSDLVIWSGTVHDGINVNNVVPISFSRAR